jgi:hypothetical protein
MLPPHPPSLRAGTFSPGGEKEVRTRRALADPTTHAFSFPRRVCARVDPIS